MDVDSYLKVASLAGQLAPHLKNNISLDPHSLAGKLVGLSGDEFKAGLPWWSTSLIGLGVGVGIGYVLSDKIRKVL